MTDSTEGIRVSDGREEHLSLGKTLDKTSRDVAIISTNAVEQF
ncbi:hypothetical protein [Thalassoglobus sp.]